MGSACTLRCAADDRKALEQLCRYITRPALANERVQDNAAGQVVLRLKTAWRDGTTHLVMSPLEFMQRLAALVPRPRLHLIRFHGVLAPNARLRALVVPQEPEPPAQATLPAECEANCAHHRPLRLYAHAHVAGIDPITGAPQRIRHAQAHRAQADHTDVLSHCFEGISMMIDGGMIGPTIAAAAVIAARSRRRAYGIGHAPAK